MNMTSGHVFVVHGQLQAVTCDAILLPTDLSFHVESHWHEVIGDAPTRPAGWSEEGRSTIDPFWIIDVTDQDRRANDPNLIRNRLANRVGEIAAHLLTRPVVRGRPRHLVAMPLLASGSGGQLATTMVSAVFDELDALAAQYGLDFAIVVPDRTAFEDLQRHRRRGEAQDDDDLAVELGLRARRGELSLMVGAGVSMGAGLPSWNGLLEAITEKVPAPDRRALIVEEPASATENGTATPAGPASFSAAFKTLPSSIKLSSSRHCSVPRSVRRSWRH